MLRTNKLCVCMSDPARHAHSFHEADANEVWAESGARNFMLGRSKRARPARLARLASGCRQ